MSKSQISASILYDLVQCPHRVTMDLFGDYTKRDEISPFVQLLWEKGSLYEKKVIANLGLPFLDLSPYKEQDKERRTLEAMNAGVGLIYNGRISSGDLLGEPDLLRKDGAGYIAGDIKSGSGEEGDEDDRKPKKHYAVQLALYTDILQQLGKSSGLKAFVWDVHGEEVFYDFYLATGTRHLENLWDFYQEILTQARQIQSHTLETIPAYSAICKNCVWYSVCQDQLRASNDLTLIPSLGRSKRDAMLSHIGSIHELAEMDVQQFIRGSRTIFQGVGPSTLHKAKSRAQLLTQPNARPYLTAPISLPTSQKEIFFDIEVDPMQDICYLHGFVERLNGNNGAERFLPVFADDPTPEAEEEAFAKAWAYIQSNPDAIIYYYSKYERTLYRKLCQKYPNVCHPEEIENMFDPARAIDLYFDVVLKAIEWPTKDYSIKTLARYLGFDWRDTHPSGAASIEWYNRWTETKDPAIKARILEYNEDDCRATRVLLDGIRGLC
ncbi:MAG: TM0106 family RecB-like putative nuclease [Alphaproteobacteria bacterium]|nr:TM0106 family RecB-like putative nuclease [Alphaproteobacteria bacterium]